MQYHVFGGWWFVLGVISSGCSAPSGYLVSDCGDWVEVGCGRWGCGVCGRKKVYRLRKRILKFLVGVAGVRWRFVTLTLGPGDSNDDVGLYWNRFRNSLAKAGYSFGMFLWVKEFQPGTGMLHLHVLVDRFVPQGVLKYYWVKAVCGTGLENYRHVFVKGVRNPGTISAYITKYLTKSVGSTGFKLGARRYGFGRLVNEIMRELEGPRRVSNWRFVLYGSFVDSLLNPYEGCVSGDFTNCGGVAVVDVDDKRFRRRRRSVWDAEQSRLSAPPGNLAKYKVFV